MMTRMLQTTRDRRRETGMLDDAPRCSRCDGPNDRLSQGQGYCRSCHNAYQKKWAADQLAMAREYRKLFHGKLSGSSE
jgi:hypothetical protein